MKTVNFVSEPFLNITPASMPRALDAFINTLGESLPASYSRVSEKVADNEYIVFRSPEVDVNLYVDALNRVHVSMKVTSKGQTFAFAHLHKSLPNLFGKLNIHYSIAIPDGALATKPYSRLF